jgi:endogenous inhibitor of DNA gyrase (YacG/DUF329 family)
MNRLREGLDADEKLAELVRPSKHKTATNRYEVHCADCGDLYYVDEHTFNALKSALEFDSTASPFCCDGCEEEYGEDEYAS